MALPEVVPTDLPTYVLSTPRENFTDSVIQDGAVLIFSQDGQSLTGKLPDGTFINLTGSGGGLTPQDAAKLMAIIGEPAASDSNA